MKHWAHRFALTHLKVREVLNAANIKSTETLLRETIRGILLAETSVLMSSEFASVLATSDRLVLRVRAVATAGSSMIL